MCGEFGEVSGIIDLVTNFLAGGTLFLNSYDTLSYMLNLYFLSTRPVQELHLSEGAQLPWLRWERHSEHNQHEKLQNFISF